MKGEKSRIKPFQCIYPVKNAKVTLVRNGKLISRLAKLNIQMSDTNRSNHISTARSYHAYHYYNFGIKFIHIKYIIYKYASRRGIAGDQLDKNVTRTKKSGAAQHHLQRVCQQHWRTALKRAHPQTYTLHINGIIMFLRIAKIILMCVLFFFSFSFL